MAIVNADILSKIVSLAQSETAFKFLKALAEIVEVEAERGNKILKLDEFEYPHDEGSRISALSFLFAYVDYLDVLLQETESVGIFGVLKKHNVSRSMVVVDPEVIRLVIEGSFADSTVRSVQFEPRGDLFNLAHIDMISFIEIEQVEIIEETVPYYLNEKELGRSIFEAEAKKIVCDALKGLVTASVASAPAQYQTRALEALKACMSTFDLSSPDTLRQFESVCHELTAANVATRQTAARASLGEHRVYKPQEGSSVKWKPSDPKIAASKRVADRHRRGMTIIDACVHEGISNGTYYAAMRYLANS